MNISINGKFVENISLTGSEPEFGMGYGVFETLRSYNGKAFHVADHLERLHYSAADILLDIKPSDDDLVGWIEDHCTSDHDVKIKLIAAKDKIYILSQPLLIDATIYQTGVSMGLQAVDRMQPSVKSISYVKEYVAHETAVKAGHHDALLMNHKQEIHEGAYSNFFSIKDNTIITPRYNILQGITRNIILRLAEPHYQIDQRKIHIDEVMLADECFLTQTTTGIVPLVRIDNHLVKSGKPGKHTKHLMEMFFEYTDGL